MSSKPDLSTALRDAILTRPEEILDDRDMMQALIEGNERRMGENIVDLRGIAMDRLEKRLDHLEDTHRSVLAAAYENLAGTNQIHRAVLRLTEEQDLGPFLSALHGDVAQILRIDAIRLVLEVAGEPLSGTENSGLIALAEPGFADLYLAHTCTGRSNAVTLRTVPDAAETRWLYEGAGTQIKSEACIRLDLNAPGLSGLLVLGAADEAQFAPHQGTDLLAFLGGALERLLRRWVP